MTDYGDYRLFQCRFCRMKLIVAIGDKRIEGLVEGNDSEDVSRVVSGTLASMGAAATPVIGPDAVFDDLLAVKSAFETDLRYEVLRLYESCKNYSSALSKATRKEIKTSVREIGAELKRRLSESPNKNPMFGHDEAIQDLLLERRRLASEIRASYNSEYHGLEVEIVNLISNQLRVIRPAYRIARNPEFGNLSPDLIDPLFGLNLEVKVIDERDDYWVAKGIKQALAYCEIGRFDRAQFVLVNFSPARYLVSSEVREGKLGGRVDVVAINLSNPPSSGVKPVTIDNQKIVSFLDVGGAGLGYFLDDTELYVGRRRFQLDVEKIDEEIT